MKRKQKLPRRTRRPTSLQPTDHEENSANPNDAKENEQDTDENSKISTNNCNDIRKEGKTFPCEMNSLMETITSFDSNASFHTEDSSLNHFKNIERKHQELAIESENLDETFPNSTKLHSNPPRNSILKRTLNPENLALSDNITKSPTAFVNFRNESEDNNMPVILNVFTLSQVPTSYNKHKTTNVIAENNFPVTPPCSPPLPKLEQFIATQKTPNETKNPFHSTTPTLKMSKTTNFYNISLPITNERQNMTNGGLLFPTGIKQCIHQRNYTPESQSTRFYDITGGAVMEHASELSVVSSSKNSAVLCDNWMPILSKLMMQPFKNIDLSPVTELSGKPSNSSARCVGESENSAKGSHVILSPREVKVLQLKRRLQEQEAALKKLRTNHGR